MIENRYRIEREILRGRQAVRKAATGQTFSIREEVVTQDPGELPDPSTGPPPASVQTAGDISTTEAENPGGSTDEGLLFASHITGLRSKSGSSTPREMKASQDPLRSPARRRRWAWTSWTPRTRSASTRCGRRRSDWGVPRRVCASCACDLALSVREQDGACVVLTLCLSLLLGIS